MLTAVLIAVAVLPGLASWWWGRRLLGHRGEAALAERYLAHNRRVYLLAIFAILAVALGQTMLDGGLLRLGVLGLPILGVLVGGFPLRRALYEETWGLGAYLLFLARLIFGLGGFWLLLVFTPFVLTYAGEVRLAGAIALALLLILWNHNYGASVLRVLGARPLEAGERERLGPLLASVDERSTAPAPEVVVVPARGGRFVNAFALASSARPRVILSGALLELFEPDEVAAVYAHEMGHLEHFQGRLLWIIALVTDLLAVLAAAWVFLPWPGPGALPAVLWPVLLILLFLTRLRWLRRHETDTDLRALELCGDPEALIRALTKLHELLLVPRRLDAETEKAMTHPTLAHRIQAIRKAAGLPPAPEEAADEEAARPAPRPETGGSESLLVRAGDGRAVLFEVDRLYWFEGLPEDLGEPSFETLHRSARTSRSTVYGELADLHLDFKGGQAPVLKLSDRKGKKRLFEIADDDVAGVQSWLDRVDDQLGKASKKAALKVRLGWQRLLAVVVAAAAIFPPMAGGVCLPAAFLALRPRTCNLAATGAAGLVGCGLCWRQAAMHPLGLYFALFTTVLLGLASVPILVTGIRRAGEHPDEQADGVWPLAITCWVATAVHWGVLVSMSTAGAGVDLFRLGYLIYWAPSAVLLPLAAATALFFVRRRGAGRWLYGVAGALVWVPFIAGSTTLRDALTGDPLLFDEGVLAEERVEVDEVARLDLDFGGSVLRLSPSGETWAVCVSEVAGFCDSQVWRLGRFDGTVPFAALAGELTGVNDVRFVDDERLVLVRREAVEVETETSSGGEPGPPRRALYLAVERRDLRSGEKRSVRLPFAGDSEIRLLAAGEDWQLTTQVSNRGGHHLRRYQGTWRDDEVAEAAWEIEPVAGGWAWGVAGAGPRALILRSHKAQVGWPGNQGYVRRNDLVTVPADGDASVLLSTRLRLGCDMPWVGLPAALCVARDHDWNYLWRVALETGDLEPLARFKSPGGDEHLAAGAGVLLGSRRASPYWLHLGTLVELEVPWKRMRQGWAAAESGEVADLRRTKAGSPSILTLYRPRFESSPAEGADADF